jgi:hypothetical protein
MPCKDNNHLDSDLDTDQCSDSESSDSSDKLPDEHTQRAPSPSTHLSSNPAALPGPSTHPPVPPFMTTSATLASATSSPLSEPIAPLTCLSARLKSHPGRQPSLQAENDKLWAHVVALESHVEDVVAHAKLALAKVQTLKQQHNIKADKSNK